ncbi:MAG: hypothetical protein GXO24_00305 [Chlorobi bacterium]|nr:hypothetical protein [Chlorobiota bacterium]
MTESAYYESMGVFFNAADADAYAGALEREGIPYNLEMIMPEDSDEVALAVEIFVKKSAADRARQIKEDIIRATLDHPDVYLHHISDDDLRDIPLHPEDANDFDYWAALELIRRKGLPLEDRDWEQFRQERLLEMMEKRIPKSSGLFPLALFIWALGVATAIFTYRTMPYVAALLFLGSLIIGRHMQKDEFGEKEQRQGKTVFWLSILSLAAVVVAGFVFKGD